MVVEADSSEFEVLWLIDLLLEAAVEVGVGLGRNDSLPN